MSTGPAQPERRWPSYRSPHRQRADAEAHAAQAPPPPVLEHALVPAGPPELVETQAGLRSLIDTLRAAGRFGYDTEFIGEETFHLRFCVIQVSTAAQVYLIDALSEGLDLLPFWELLADPMVQVLVHAGLQDLEPVQRMTGRPPGNVFDMQIAAGFIGLPYPVSLTKLVLSVTGAELGTSSKFSQWDRRPLSAVQQNYAANDVRYLLLLYERVTDQLAALGHTDKAAAEFAQFARPETYRIDPLTMKLKARGGTGLKRQQQAIVDALLLWRATEAQRRDVPMRALLDDQILVDLARQPVTSEAEIQRFKGMPWPVKEAYATTLVELTAAALEGELPNRKKIAKPLGEQAQALLERVWLAAIAACEAASISPSLVMTKREVTAMVRVHAYPQRGTHPDTERITTGWRGQLLAPVWEQELA